jgi:hypothetical protein
MAITFGRQSIHGRPTIAGVSLISDDNNSPTQFTRVLNLVAILPEDRQPAGGAWSTGMDDCGGIATGIVHDGGSSAPGTGGVVASDAAPALVGSPYSVWAAQCRCAPYVGHGGAAPVAACLVIHQRGRFVSRQRPQSSTLVDHVIPSADAPRASAYR